MIATTISNSISENPFCFLIGELHSTVQLKEPRLAMLYITHNVLAKRTR
jgi:hypothetical protein